MGWASERAVTEHIVKFTVVSFAHGVRKIFFHAGTCGTINGPDAGGVLFEYGGAPRKMYAGVAAMTRLLGVPEACVKTVHEAGLAAYVFGTGGQVVAIAWCDGTQRIRLKQSPSVQTYDIMGNSLSAAGPILGESPVYLVGSSAASVLAPLAR